MGAWIIDWPPNNIRIKNVTLIKLCLIWRVGEQQMGKQAQCKVYGSIRAKWWMIGGPLSTQLTCLTCSTQPRAYCSTSCLPWALLSRHHVLLLDGRWWGREGGGLPLTPPSTAPQRQWLFPPRNAAAAAAQANIRCDGSLRLGGISARRMWGGNGGRMNGTALCTYYTYLCIFGGHLHSEKTHQYIL